MLYPLNRLIASLIGEFDRAYKVPGTPNFILESTLALPVLYWFRDFHFTCYPFPNAKMLNNLSWLVDLVEFWELHSQMALKTVF